jgi:hypothetical protein
MITGYLLREEEKRSKPAAISVAAIVWHRAYMTFLIENGGGGKGVSNPSDGQLDYEEGEE